MSVETKRMSSTLGRVAARHAIKAYFATERGKTVDINDITISPSRGKKPTFSLKGKRIRNVDFSISHTAGIAVAVAHSGRIGIDVERPRAFKAHILKAFLTPQEYRSVRKRRGADRMR